jgi:hypothetical protein
MPTAFRFNSASSRKRIQLGNYSSIDVVSKSNRQIVLSAVDPYFTADGISRTRLIRPDQQSLSGQGGDYNSSGQCPFWRADALKATLSTLARL